MAQPGLRRPTGYGVIESCHPGSNNCGKVGQSGISVSVGGCLRLEREQADVGATLASNRCTAPCCEEGRPSPFLTVYLSLVTRHAGGLFQLGLGNAGCWTGRSRGGRGGGKLVAASIVHGGQETVLTMPVQAASLLFVSMASVICCGLLGLEGWWGAVDWKLEPAGPATAPSFSPRHSHLIRRCRGARQFRWSRQSAQADALARSLNRQLSPPLVRLYYDICPLPPLPPSFHAPSPGSCNLIVELKRIQPIFDQLLAPLRSFPPRRSFLIPKLSPGNCWPQLLDHPPRPRQLLRPPPTTTTCHPILLFSPSCRSAALFHCPDKACLFDRDRPTTALL